MSDKPLQPPMSQAVYARHRREQAEERMRRGLPTFTRSSVREEVFGVTKGENKLQQTQRYSQVQRPRPGQSPR